MSNAISREDVIDILLNEMECVQRASDGECNRDCAKCDLLRDTEQILQAYRIAIKALEHPEENVVKIIPHGDLISRQDVIKALDKWYLSEKWYLPEDKKDALTEVINDLPSTEKTGHCKDCKYFKYDVVAKVDGISLIVGPAMCHRWGDGCTTQEDGYCFLFERGMDNE